jgi:pimeloyl-ACP methyl ester carboxylesterase
MERFRPAAVEAGGPGGELAAISPLDPSPSEEGFLDSEVVYRSLTSLDPLSVVSGLWRGVDQVKRRALREELPHSAAVPKRVFLPGADGHEHLLLVTEPDPETGVDPRTADNDWIKSGLGELADAGSGLRFHVAFAESHPGHRVITEATPGMSHTGKTSSADELSGRRIEPMAAESLRLMSRLTQEGRIWVIGKSLGSRLAAAMAELNLAANPEDRLDIVRLQFISSAVVASKIDGDENFRDPDVDEDEYRQALSKRFQHHIPEDFMRMLYSHPREILACWPMLGAYALAHPGKTQSRLRAMAADYANVKEGVPWSSLKYVVSGVPVDVLDGSRDPLSEEQKPQWDTLAHKYPGQVRQKVIDGMGHLMSAAARFTIGHLDDMEDQGTQALAAAA